MVSVNFSNQHGPESLQRSSKVWKALRGTVRSGATEVMRGRRWQNGVRTHCRAPLAAEGLLHVTSKTRKIAHRGGVVDKHSSISVLDRANGREACDRESRGP